MYIALAPKLFYFESVYQESEKFLEALNHSPDWEPWMSGGDANPVVYGKLKTFHTELYKNIKDQDLKKYNKFVINSIKKVNLICGTQYLKAFNASENQLKRFKRCVLTDKITLGVKKYYENGLPLGPHPDVDLNSTYDQISITFYPNDSYQGGEINFPDLDIKVKPKAGSALIYPSKYIHESLAATSGEKIVTNYVYIGAEKIWN